MRTMLYVLRTGWGEVAAVLAAALFLGLAAWPAEAQRRPDILDVDGTSITGCAVGDGILLYSSTVHLNWFPAAGTDTSLAYTSVVSAGGRYVVVADDGTVWRSTGAEGNVFNAVVGTGAGALFGLAEIGPSLIAVGAAGAILKSGDLTGANWTQENSPVSTTLRAVAGNGVSSVAVGDGGTVVRGGSFGTVWQEVEIQEDRDLLALAVNPSGQYLAVGEDGAMWRGQPDGLTWSLLLSPTSETLHAACAVGPATVVVGQGGVIFYSSGGFTGWQAPVSPTTRDLNGVCFTGSDVVAVGDRYTVIWSLMGLQWDPAAVPVQESSWGRLKNRFVLDR